MKIDFSKLFVVVLFCLSLTGCNSFTNRKDASKADISDKNEVEVFNNTQKAGEYSNGVYTCPLFLPIFNGKYLDGDEVPKSELLESSKLYLIAVSANVLYDVILKFDFVYTESGLEQRINCHGPELNDEIIAKIQKMPSGSVISFCKIEWQNGNQIEKSGGITLTIR